LKRWRILSVARCSTDERGKGEKRSLRQEEGEREHKTRNKERGKARPMILNVCQRARFAIVGAWKDRRKEEWVKKERGTRGDKIWWKKKKEGVMLVMMLS
jgi:hypothetical protein